MIKIDETEMFNRTSRALTRAAEKLGTIPQQPSRTTSGWDGSVYVLRNVNGDLARFTYDENHDRIRRVSEPNRPSFVLGYPDATMGPATLLHTAQSAQG